MRHRQGRFRPATGAGRSEATASVLVTDADPASEPSAPSGSALSAADLSAPLGTRATLVQFSTEVCAYCGPTRELLTEVAGARDGVAFVEIDAAQRMDLTRRLHVLATPTVLVLDALGGIASRASGPLRRADLLTAVGAVLDADGAVIPQGDPVSQYPPRRAR
jgi:Thioredoxin